MHTYYVETEMINGDILCGTIKANSYEDALRQVNHQIKHHGKVILVETWAEHVLATIDPDETIH